MIVRALLEANLSFPISISQPISPYQLDTMLEVDISIPHYESKTTNFSLSLLLLLSTPLLVCSWVLRPKQNVSHTDYNHEFQPKIDIFLEFKSLSQIKTKDSPLGIKNKRFSIEARLGEYSTQQDLSRFEYNIDQIS